MRQNNKMTLGSEITEKLREICTDSSIIECSCKYAFIKSLLNIIEVDEVPKS